MNCKYVSGLISEYVDGNLTQAEAAEFEAHVSDCPSCSAELEATADLVASLSGLGGLRSPTSSWAGIQSRVAGLDTTGTPWWRWVLRPVVAAPTAAVLALVGISLLLPLGGRDSLDLNTAVAKEYSYYIAAHSGLQRAQMFADPDAVFIVSEVQKAELLSGAGRQ